MYFSCFIAKHLALHGCRSAYSSQEEAQKAAIPVLQGPDEEDLESFDPNEEYNTEDNTISNDDSSTEPVKPKPQKKPRSILREARPSHRIRKLLKSKSK